ncbi:MAG: hypothetical protein M4579_000229 [Chaenotheca gracillima]|nr:MAG: hypothetical protein M4579_000229 [Chaenotheca gracillima]
MPSGLDIDYGKPLNGSMASYTQQLLLCTGKDDWPSKIETEEGVNAAQGLGQLLGRGGKFSNPFHRVAVTNASFKSAPPTAGSKSPSTSAYLLPDFKWIPQVPLDMNSLETLAQDYLSSTPIVGSEGSSNGDKTTASALRAQSSVQSQDFREVLVLICGHGGRDQRCGVMGPLLRSEFHKVISSDDRFTLQTEEPNSRVAQPDSSATTRHDIRVGLISHIGGHKFAGNVIVYIPSTFGGPEQRHALAGKGIWYGRVEPKHVDGIIRETIVKGNVISELFRGGIDQDGQILRI